MKKKGEKEKEFKGLLSDQVIEEGKSLLNELAGVGRSLKKYN